MNNAKMRYVIFALVAAAIIIFAGGYQLPMYASRLTALAALAIFDILIWLSVRKYVVPRYVTYLKISYWLPITFLLAFFIGGLFAPYTQWPSLLRIYIPGILMVLLIGKGVFLTFYIVGSLLNGILKILNRFFSGLNNKLEIKPGLILFIATCTSFTMMLIYFSGMIFWVNSFRLSTVEIEMKGLPREFDGYKIIQISDLHLGSYVTSRPLEKMIQIVNAEQPDIIVFTGDLVNFTTEEALPFENKLKQFSAKDGIYSILGNHDYGEYSQWESKVDKDRNDRALFELYQRIGWRLLRNQNSIIKRDSDSIAIVGVENWSMTKRFGKKGDISKAIIGCEQVHTKILLSHDPSHWDGEINRQFQEIGLTLSGHTHAFQFAIEIGNFKWSPASMLYTQWGGLYEKLNLQGTKQYLYVNRGAGTLGYPGRIATFPEITLIILRGQV